jgi:hypothetical protein
VTFLSVTLNENGDLRRNEWPEASEELHRLMQLEVGGFIELIALTRDLHVWVNDEGLFKCMRNPWLEAYTRPYGWGHTRLFGPAVFTGGATGEGDTASLTEEQVTQLLTWPGWPRRIETGEPL